jgi:hypothetical protein
VNVKVVPLSIMPFENLNTICFGIAAIVAPAFGCVETTFECAAKPYDFEDHDLRHMVITKDERKITAAPVFTS